MRVISYLVLASTLAFPAAALASERDATAAETRRVVQKLSSMGYSKIVDVDVVNGRFEADARSPKGRDVDVILDMNSLNIIRVESS